VLPRLIPTTELQQAIYAEAQLRRAGRLKEREDPSAAIAAAETMLKPVTHRDGSPTLAPALEARPSNPH